MKKYLEPVVNIIYFETEDIITSSGNNGQDENELPIL